MALTISSCGEDEADYGALEDFRLDIVTYKNFSEGIAYFQYVDRNGGITELEAHGAAKPDIAKDHRVLMRYKVTAEQQGCSQIGIYSITGIISDSLRVNKLPLEEYEMHGMRLRSIWQTGEFINFRCQVEYTGEARSFYLMMDEATRDNEVVDCYLIHDLKGQEPLHWRDCYASFNVGALMKRPTCRTLRIHLTDVVRPDAGEYVFSMK
ncbi:MAG: hypothetical protein IJ626_00595 [Muribaculaceae bacterium]|nr:hypothetical protein [Muribaculaceae bacterium]